MLDIGASAKLELVDKFTGDIADDKRTCLLCENLERLVFLKANLM